MSRSDPQFNLRLPVELKERLSEAATSNKRSITGEIIARLEDSFEAEARKFIEETDFTEGTPVQKSITVEEAKRRIIEAFDQVAAAVEPDTHREK